MNNKGILLAAVVLTLAFAALPATASAGTPQTHCNSGATCAFTLTSPMVTWSTSSGFTFSCTKMAGSGTLGTSGGSIKIEFQGCKEPVFGTACLVPTIEATYDNTYVTDAKTAPGMLITGPAGEVWGAAGCQGLFASETKGNGLIGRLESPACGVSANNYLLAFETTAHGQQKYKKVTETGTQYDLRVEGLQPATTGLAGTATINIPAGATLTCV